MQRPHRQKNRRSHVCILVNESAHGYRSDPIDRLIGSVRKRGWQYTVIRPSSALELADTARAACGHRRGRRLLPPNFQKRGPVTSLVAAGGDGTFNLVARAALRADIPLGLLPMGRFNNIGRSLFSDLSVSASINRIMSEGTRPLDVGVVNGQLFFGSIGIGLIPRLAATLAEQKTPRFGLSWGRMVSHIAGEIKTSDLLVKLDSFRFEISPRLLNVNLLSRSSGLNLSPASLSDDNRVEVIFDFAASQRELGAYARQVFAGKFIYGSTVRLFRGAVVTIEPVLEQTMYLDGELIVLPTNTIDIKINEKQLKVYG